MQYDSKIKEQVKVQMHTFCQKLNHRLAKPKQRFISQMVFGIQASRDVKLSNISRSLQEPIKLIKTENRLSRQLSQTDLTAPVHQALLADGAHRIGTDTVLALDLSDLNQPFARKMEYLTQVWDGAEGKVGQGYWLCEVIGAAVTGEEMVPLYSELYSQEAQGFGSENQPLFKAIETVNQAVGGRGIWVMDRGGARGEILERLQTLGVRFVIRLKLDRHLTTATGREEAVGTFARRSKCREPYHLRIDQEGYDTEFTVRLGKTKPITIRGITLTLVVIKGLGSEPMVLATNLEQGAKEVFEIYLTRWKCEESFRFLKQEYQREDIRVRSDVSLRNTVVLVHAVFYFVSVHLGRRLKVRILLAKILEKARRFFQIPLFKHYAIADGMYRLLFNVKWDFGEHESMQNTEQILFAFATEK